MNTFTPLLRVIPAMMMKKMRASAMVNGRCCCNFSRLTRSRSRSIIIERMKWSGAMAASSTWPKLKSNAERRKAYKWEIDN